MCISLYSISCVTSDKPINILCSVQTAKLPFYSLLPAISPLFAITNVLFHMPAPVQTTKSRNILVFNGEGLLGANLMCGTVPYRLSTAACSAQSSAATYHICRRRLVFTTGRCAPFVASCRSLSLAHWHTPIDISAVGTVPCVHTASTWLLLSLSRTLTD